jgi:hypothetical protein
MSERIRGGELDPSSVITGAMWDWLQDEIDNSMAGRNAVLDNRSDFENDLRLPFSDLRNQDGGKARSHHNRLHGWTMATEMYPTLVEDDYFLARQIWAAQMFISGAFRKQAFLRTESQQEYVHYRRQHGPTGIDLKSVIAERVQQHEERGWWPRPAYQDSPWARILNNTIETNDLSLVTAEQVHDIAARGNRGSREQAARLLHDTQSRWARLAVDYILFSAQNYEGDLGAVAVLEPKSISDSPAMCYPFAVKR